MNTNEVLNGLNDAITAYHRLPVVESELKLVTEDRDWTKLQLDEANETIAKLKLQIEAQATDNAADKVKISNLENQITELNQRNADLDDMVRYHSNTAETLQIDYEVIKHRLEIALADKASLETKLSDAKSFGARLAEKLADIGSLISQSPEATNTAPFPVSDPVAMPIASNDPVVDHITGSSAEPVVSTTGQDMVNEDAHKVAAGCNPYRYW